MTSAAQEHMDQGLRIVMLVDRASPASKSEIPRTPQPRRPCEANELHALSDLP